MSNEARQCEIVYVDGEWAWVDVNDRMKTGGYCEGRGQCVENAMKNGYEVLRPEPDTIYNEPCLDTLAKMDDNSIDLVVTSPPYDDLRNYNGYSFDFDPMPRELRRVLKPGRAVVWVVGDACVDGSETGTSFRQALAFMEAGFKLHDTMIYEKNSSSFPARRTSKRYTQIFEYMFVFTKGKIRDDITLIADKPNKWAGHTNWGKLTQYGKDGHESGRKEKINPVPEFSLRTNIWRYTTSVDKGTGNHPAIFPEKLAEDHILSWTVPGDIVYDPFMGSGTTAKMAVLNNRHYIGSEISSEYCEIIRNRLESVQPTIIAPDQV